MELRIAYITTAEYTNKHGHAETLYYMAKALQKHCGDVQFIGPINSFARKYAGRLLDIGTKFLLEERIAEHNLLFVAKRHAQILTEILHGASFDVIIAPLAAPEIAFLKTNIPIILIEESPFALPHTYYPDYTDLIDWSMRQGDQIEIAAYTNASALLFCSHWAAQAAIDEYYADPNKVFVAPFGANLATIPPKEIALTKKTSYRCNLLFIGDHWEKKGGEIAYETLLALEDMGIEVELTVCGTTPPKEYAHTRIKVIPFLNKNDEHQKNELERLYRIADMLILPHRTESYRSSCCEASAYGIPSLIAKTGSATEIVHHGESGFILPYEARGDAYAKIIAKIYNDDLAYRHLARSSRKLFEERLNWDQWGKTIHHIIQAILEWPETAIQ